MTIDFNLVPMCVFCLKVIRSAKYIQGFDNYNNKYVDMQRHAVNRIDSFLP